MALQQPEETPLWVRRWSARAWLWNNSQISSIRNCGRALQGEVGNVRTLRYPSGQVADVATQSCKSVWSCPVCSAKIVDRRGQQLQRVVEGWHERGGRVGFLTLTLRHTAKQSLTDVWQLVADAFARFQGGGGTGSWRQLQDRWGTSLPGRGGRVMMRIPIVRTTEVTYGRHGWHVHLHLLVFFDGGTSPADRWDDLAGGMVERWRKAVTSCGGKVAVRQATHAELIDPDADASHRIGEYLAKSVFVGHGDHSAIHWEMAGGVGKDSTRTGGLTPWELLDLAKAGDAKAAKLWTVWELGSRGRRQMWINGTLQDLFGLRDESDADAFDAADDRSIDWLPADNVALCQNAPVQGPPELVADIPADVWRSLANNHQLGALTLGWCRTRGDLAAALRQLGIPIRHGTDPAYDCVVVPWREWTASFAFGSW